MNYWYSRISFITYYYYFYYYILQIVLPPQFAIFLEVFWQNTFWKTFKRSLLLVKPVATELQRH